MPHRLDAKSLETFGETKLGETIDEKRSIFSAHPRIDTARGRLVGFGNHNMMEVRHGHVAGTSAGACLRVSTMSSTEVRRLAKVRIALHTWNHRGWRSEVGKASLSLRYWTVDVAFGPLLGGVGVYVPWPAAFAEQLLGQRYRFELVGICCPLVKRCGLPVRGGGFVPAAPA